jgi:hypothetical protein
VLLEGSTLVLSDDLDPGQSRIDHVGEDDIDDAVSATERYRRLRSFGRQRAEPTPLATGEDHREDAVDFERGV